MSVQSFSYSVKPQFGGLVPKRLQARQAQKKWISALSQRPVWLSSDIDSTFVGWKADSTPMTTLLEQNKATLRKYAKDMTVHLTTGRGMVAIKEISDLFSNMPLDVLSLNNGQEHYYNVGRKPADAWIQSLSLDDQDKAWQAEVKLKTKWDFKVAQKTVLDVFSEAGFREVDAEQFTTGSHRDFKTAMLEKPNGQKLLVNWYTTTAGFALSGLVTLPDGTLQRVYRPEDEAVANALIAKVVAKLTQQGRNITYGNMKAGHEDHQYGVFALMPGGVTKATGTQYMMNRFADKAESKIKGVITAGDHHYNDTELLQEKTYGKKQLPNHAIVSGDNTELRQLMRGKKYIQVQEGDLTPAFDLYVGKILNSVG